MSQHKCGVTSLCNEDSERDTLRMNLAFGGHRASTLSGLKHFPFTQGIFTFPIFNLI